MKLKLLPKKILRQLFFDFYVLNELWFKTIGISQYGYNVTKILPFKKEQAIDETFKTKVSILKENIINALEYSVRSEIKHFHQCCWHFEPIQKKTSQFGERYGKSYLNKKSLEIIEEAFSLRWVIGYGGKKWAVATHWLIKLKNSNSIKDDIFIIDRIFDLQHNNGFILDKTNFIILEDGVRADSDGFFYGPKPLNIRFKSTPEKMLEFCSSYTVKLWKANKNYI